MQGWLFRGTATNTACVAGSIIRCSNGRADSLNQHGCVVETFFSYIEATLRMLIGSLLRMRRGSAWRAVQPAYCPDQPVTRAEMASFIIRALQ